MKCPVCKEGNIVAVCSQRIIRYRKVLDTCELGEEVGEEEYEDEYTEYYECDECGLDWGSLEGVLEAYGKE